MKKLKLSDINLLSIGNSIHMTGAVYSGDGQTFVAFFPEDSNDLPVGSLEMDLPDWQTFLRQTDYLETEVLAHGENGELTKAILRKSQRQIDQNVSWKVYRRDSYTCRYCGSDSVPLTIDHLVLWEVGGPTTEQNLVAACKKCNRTRANTSYQDWLEHPYYKKVSANLSPQAKEANRSLLTTLSAIPRTVHKRSR